jgi:hypothetical protein
MVYFPPEIGFSQLDPDAPKVGRDLGCEGFWVGDYGGGVRVGRPFGARCSSPVRGLKGDLKNKRSTHIVDSSVTQGNRQRSGQNVCVCVQVCVSEIHARRDPRTRWKQRTSTPLMKQSASNNTTRASTQGTIESQLSLVCLCLLTLLLLQSCC